MHSAERKKQFTSYRNLGKGAGFAVGFIDPESSVQWAMRMTSFPIIDCKIQHSLDGWLTVHLNDKALKKDAGRVQKFIS